MDTLKLDFEPSWMSVAAAAEKLRVSPQRVGQLIKSGALVGRKSRHTWLVSTRSVEGRVQLLLSEAGGKDASR